ncbi:probable F-box protein At5g04010 [Salvia miltiorrhiza]|uniref:probable F-box protein At5g04010 n=1 Tax=Salvia miltiorrhiza TaxID=226208 RepID=UPI0025AD7514|nr:probable F-box protein At5g04010 [Salvia miltiorrhiza]
MMKKRSPPWQVLDLVAHRLDAETLATAACVCKSWSTAMSADHLWQPICSAVYPSLSNLHPTGVVPYRRLYALGRAAEKRRLRSPPKPTLSMRDLVFAVDVHNGRGCVATVVSPGGGLQPNKGSGVFQFDIGVDGGNMVAFEELDSLRITWNVVLQGLKGVFTMMDCRGKGSFVLGLEGWFSKELPPPGCCSGGAASGLVADLRLGLRESVAGKVVVEKISVGVLSIVSWRYVCIDDALRYLQHFLLPS